MSLSDRERPEGFQLSPVSAVAAESLLISSAVAVTIARVQATDTLAGYIRRLPQ